MRERTAMDHKATCIRATQLMADGGPADLAELHPAATEEVPA